MGFFKKELTKAIKNVAEGAKKKAASKQQTVMEAKPWKGSPEQASLLLMPGSFRFHDWA